MNRFACFGSVLLFLMESSLFSAVVVPRRMTLNVSSTPVTLQELVKRLEELYPLQFVTASELSTRSVRFERTEMKLTEFLDEVSEQLQVGYILQGPDNVGRYRILLAPRQGSGGQGRASEYRESSAPFSSRPDLKYNRKDYKPEEPRPDMRSYPSPIAPKYNPKSLESDNPTEVIPIIKPDDTKGSITIPTAGSLQSPSSESSKPSHAPPEKPKKTPH